MSVYSVSNIWRQDLRIKAVGTSAFNITAVTPLFYSYTPHMQSLTNTLLPPIRTPTYPTWTLLKQLIHMPILTSQLPQSCSQVPHCELQAVPVLSSLYSSIISFSSFTFSGASNQILLLFFLWFPCHFYVFVFTTTNHCDNYPTWTTLKQLRHSSTAKTAIRMPLLQLCHLCSYATKVVKPLQQSRHYAYTPVMSIVRSQLPQCCS